MQERTYYLAVVAIAQLPLLLGGCGTRITAPIDTGDLATPALSTPESGIAVASEIDSVLAEAASDIAGETVLETDDAVSLAQAAAAPGTVTSQLDLPQCDGILRTKFVATPAGDGTWNVAAEVRPSRVQMVLIMHIGPGSHPIGTLKGVGAADFVASPGTPVSVFASGLRFDARFAGTFDAGVGMSLTIGANGVVSVGSHYVAINCVFCGISCIN